MYGDKQRQAVDNRITPGDKILLKNTKQSGKLAANFEPNPYTVQTKEGQELTLKLTDGTVQPRNCSYRTPQESDNSTGAETLEGRVTLLLLLASASDQVTVKSLSTSTSVFVITIVNKCWANN